MSLADTIERLAGHKPRNFAAPIPTRNTTKVFSLQEKIPYWFSVNVDEPGWYLLSPDNHRVSVVKELLPYERLQYLEQLKRFYVIALFPIDSDNQTWLVSPYNVSDAEQRGWKDGAPKQMYLVEDEIQPLQIIDARLVGNSLLYNEIAVVGKSADMYHAECIVRQRIQQLQFEEERKQIAEKQKTERGRIEASLEFMGASLVGYTPTVQGYNVTWMHNGRQHSMEIDRNLRVRSAGVCLAGTDAWHSLSSVVAVMEDRHSAINRGDHEDW
jgi:hypothetical protein